jgi:nucleotide-binding universal stress UspA family protein
VSAIVVGYDGSACAELALDCALDLALALGDPLVVAYAAEPPGRVAGEEFGEHRRALEELGRAATEQAVQRAEARGVEVEPVVVPQRPADALIRLADERGARMIVVGASGEGPIAAAILGSVPYKLLHRSTVPVLVVPGGDA